MRPADDFLDFLRPDLYDTGFIRPQVKRPFLGDYRETQVIKLQRNFLLLHDFRVVGSHEHRCYVASQEETRTVLQDLGR